MMAATNGNGESRGLGSLEYGTQVIVDLRGAPAEALADGGLLRSSVDALLRYLEGENPAGVVYGNVNAADGVTIAGCSRSGSGVVLHAFPALRRASLRLYSGRTTSAFEAVAEFRRAFPIGKVELSVSGRYRHLAANAASLQAELMGERRYVTLRLAALNGPTGLEPPVTVGCESSSSLPERGLDG